MLTATQALPRRPSGSRCIRQGFVLRPTADCLLFIEVKSKMISPSMKFKNLGHRVSIELLGTVFRLNFFIDLLWFSAWRKAVEAAFVRSAPGSEPLFCSVTLTPQSLFQIQVAIKTTTTSGRVAEAAQLPLLCAVSKPALENWLEPFDVKCSCRLIRDVPQIVPEVWHYQGTDPASCSIILHLPVLPSASNPCRI